MVGPAFAGCFGEAGRTSGDTERAMSRMRVGQTIVCAVISMSTWVGAAPASAGQFGPPPPPPPVWLAPLPVLPHVPPVLPVAPLPPLPPVWLERAPGFAWIADEQSAERAARDRERASRIVNGRRGTASAVRGIEPRVSTSAPGALSIGRIGREPLSSSES